MKVGNWRSGADNEVIKDITELEEEIEKLCKKIQM